MPSQLRARVTQAREAQQPTKLVPIRAAGPWMGYSPDLSHALVDFKSACEMKGLHVRSVAQFGELLTNDFGYETLDSPDALSANLAVNLPLKGVDAAANWLSGATDTGGNTIREVIRLHGMLRTNTSGVRTGTQDLTLFAIVAGDGSTAATGALWRFDPQNTEWVRCPHTTYTAGVSADTAGASADIDGDSTDNSMPDTCVYPPGVSGVVEEPILVWCNNVDEVFIFPSTAAGVEYSTLQATGTTGFTTFRAKSCAYWDGRLWFLNTEEDSVRYRRRLRWSQINTGLLDIPNVGAGAFDVNDFERDALRVEPFEDALALYFEDGISFVYRSGSGLISQGYNAITNDRGLLGTHSLARIGRNTHFGIFTDGFWLVDASGRFREAGLHQPQGQQPTRKWHDTFFRKLDQSKLHRIQCQYDHNQELVRISWPNRETGVQEVWSYDIMADRMFPESWTATCFTIFPIQTAEAGTIDGLDAFSGTIDDLDSVFPTIDSMGENRFEQSILIHADTQGFVFKKNPDIVTQNGQEPAYSYHTHLHSFDDPRMLSTSERGWVEYVRTGTSGASLSTGIAIVTADDTVINSVLISEGDPDKLRTAQFFGRVSGQHFQLQIQNSGEVKLRSFGLDVWQTPSEHRR